MEFRPGWVYLVITNVADMPIVVTGVTTDAPRFLDLQPTESYTGTLQPQETRTIPILVDASDAVQPGRHLLLFDVGLAWEKAGRTQTGSIVTSHTIQVGVLGENEILTLLAVPSFLVLPGVLVLTTLGILKGRADEMTNATSRKFWVGAISISLITALLYPLVTGAVGPGRNYLDGYGLRDVLYVWLAAIGLTAAGYYLWRGAAAGRASFQARRERQRRPAAGDPPLTVLRKLPRQGLGLELPQAELTLDGEPERVFLLEPPDVEREEIWVGPEVVLEWRYDRMQADDEDLRRQVLAQLSADGDPQVLTGLLEEGQTRGVLEVVWRPAARLRGPYQAAKTDIKIDDLPPNVLVREAE
jgi:hypothetical protein